MSFRLSEANGEIYMNDKIKVAIAGGTGYTGGELFRILLNHPSVEIVAATISTEGWLRRILNSSPPV